MFELQLVVSSLRLHGSFASSKQGEEEREQEKARVNPFSSSSFDYSFRFIGLQLYNWILIQYEQS